MVDVEELGTLKVALESNAKQFNDGIASVMAEIKKLDATLSGVEKETKTHTGTMAEHFKKLGQGMTAIGIPLAAIGTAITAGLGLAVKSFADFEYQMRKVSSTAGSTQEEFIKLSEFAREMGATTVFTAKEAAEGLYYLASAGFNAGQQMQATAAILSLAAATQTDLGTSSSLVATTLKGFGLAAGEAGRVSDVLAQNVRLSMGEMSKLAVSMPYVAPLFRQLGYSVETASAALAILYDSGLEASTAGQYLRASINDLLNPTDKMIAAMTDLGIKQQELNPMTHSLVEIITRLKDANMDASDSAKLFGDRAAAMTILVAAGGDKLEYMTQEMVNSGGVAKKMADENLNSLTGSVKLLMSAVDELKISFGEKLAPALRSIADVLSSVATAFSKIPDSIQSVIAIEGGIVGTLAAISGAGLILVGQLPRLAEGFALLGVTLKSLPAIIGGVTLALGVAGLIGAFVGLKDAISKYNVEFDKAQAKWLQSNQFVVEYIDNWNKLHKTQIAAADVIKVVGDRLLVTDEQWKQYNFNTKDSINITTALTEATRNTSKELGWFDQILVKLGESMVLNKSKTDSLITSWSDIEKEYKAWQDVTGEGYKASAAAQGEYLTKLRAGTETESEAWKALTNLITEARKKQADDVEEAQKKVVAALMNEAKSIEAAGASYNVFMAKLDEVQAKLKQGSKEWEVIQQEKAAATTQMVQASNADIARDEAAWLQWSKNTVADILAHVSASKERVKLLEAYEAEVEVNLGRESESWKVLSNAIVAELNYQLKLVEETKHKEFEAYDKKVKAVIASEAEQTKIQQERLEKIAFVEGSIMAGMVEVNQRDADRIVEVNKWVNEQIKENAKNNDEVIKWSIDNASALFDKETSYLDILGKSREGTRLEQVNRLNDIDKQRLVILDQIYQDTIAKVEKAGGDTYQIELDYADKRQKILEDLSKHHINLQDYWSEYAKDVERAFSVVSGITDIFWHTQQIETTNWASEILGITKKSNEDLLSEEEKQSAKELAIIQDFQLSQLGVHEQERKDVLANFDALEELYKKHGLNVSELEKWKTDQLMALEKQHFIDRLNSLQDFIDKTAKLLNNLTTIWKDASTIISKVADWVGGGGETGTAGAIANLATAAAGAGAGGSTAGTIATAAGAGGSALGAIGAGLGKAGSAIASLPWGAIGTAALNAIPLAAGGALLYEIGDKMGQGLMNSIGNVLGFDWGNQERAVPTSAADKAWETLGDKLTAEFREQNRVAELQHQEVMSLAQDEAVKLGAQYANDAEALKFLAESNSYIKQIAVDAGLIAAGYEASLRQAGATATIRAFRAGELNQAELSKAFQQTEKAAEGLSDVLTGHSLDDDLIVVSNAAVTASSTIAALSQAMQNYNIWANSALNAQNKYIISISSLGKTFSEQINKGNYIPQVMEKLFAYGLSQFTSYFDPHGYSARNDAIKLVESGGFEKAIAQLLNLYTSSVSNIEGRLIDGTGTLWNSMGTVEQAALNLSDTLTGHSLDDDLNTATNAVARASEGIKNFTQTLLENQVAQKAITQVSTGTGLVAIAPGQWMREIQTIVDTEVEGFIKIADNTYKQIETKIPEIADNMTNGFIKISDGVYMRAQESVQKIADEIPNGFIKVTEGYYVRAQEESQAVADELVAGFVKIADNTFMRINDAINQAPWNPYQQGQRLAGSATWNPNVNTPFGIVPGTAISNTTEPMPVTNSAIDSIAMLLAQSLARQGYKLVAA